MKIDRRKFLQGTAAAAAAGMFGPNAWAEDPINVASIHDLSGGLDIYGKPMVDALTFAVEGANEVGGLLGRQIKLISYNTQSNMQLYTQFAQQVVAQGRIVQAMDPACGIVEVAEDNSLGRARRLAGAHHLAVVNLRPSRLYADA